MLNGFAIRVIEPRPEAAWAAYFKCMVRDDQIGICATPSERAQLLDDLRRGRLVYWRSKPGDFGGLGYPSSASPSSMTPG
jgi:hypothetical protein